jgi:hypothetical protein
VANEENRTYASLDLMPLQIQKYLSDVYHIHIEAVIKQIIIYPIEDVHSDDHSCLLPGFPVVFLYVVSVVPDLLLTFN